MKTLEKILNGTGIKVVRGDYELYYPEKLIVEIGGPRRYRDPSIWGFDTEDQAVEFFSEIMKTFKMKEALDILRYHIERYKRNNDSFSRIDMTRGDIKKLLKCTGWNDETQLSVLIDMKLCGQNYDLVVEERLGWWLNGNISLPHSDCYHCKNCSDRLYDSMGYLACDCMVSRISPPEYQELFSTVKINEVKTIESLMDIQTGDIYTSLRLSPMKRCRQRTRRSSILETLSALI